MSKHTPTYQVDTLLQEYLAGTTEMRNDARSQLVAVFEQHAELLGACKAIVAEIDPHGSMTDTDLSSHRPIIAARAAIAKAEGGAA